MLFYYTIILIVKFTNLTLRCTVVQFQHHVIYKNKSTAFLLEYTLLLVTSKITKTLFVQLEIADTPMLASD